MATTSWTEPLREPMPLAEWKDTKDTLHLFAQMVGKVRLALHPPRNHWWHVPLYPTPRGLTTALIPYGHGAFEVGFDLVDHALHVVDAGGGSHGFALEDGLTVADFHRQLFDALERLGVEARIRAVPFDRPTTTPFAEDTAHASWDRAAIDRFRRMLTDAAGTLEHFRGRYRGKSSPVHFFWHSFDLALTRFSGRPAPAAMVESMGRVEREAYSHEVASFGFWVGDDQVPAPAYYAYVAPEPAHLADEPLGHPQAQWADRGGSHLAILPHDAVRGEADPRAAVLDFFEHAWHAGVRRTGWPLPA